MPSRMRAPEDVRLDLPNDDDWIIVKKHLTAGEERRIYGRMIRRMIPGEPIEMDPEQAGLSQMVEYLLDWSLLDVEGKPLVIRGKSADVKAAFLGDLPGEKFREILDAVQTHEAAMTALREAEKKDRAGATASSATSVSVG